MMLFSELIEAAKDDRLVTQLIYLKRCFGGHSKIGIVISAGETVECGTVKELASLDDRHSRLVWIDKWLPGVFAISTLSLDDFELSRVAGPPSPWDIAKQSQEAARERAKKRRMGR